MVYIELKTNFSVGENLSSRICAALDHPQTSLRELCRRIQNDRILIVLDKSNKIEKLDYNILSKTVDTFIDETIGPKFLIITGEHCKLNCDNVSRFEVDELNPKQSARLLLMSASNYIEERNKDLDILSEHDIFKLISRNPSSILRFA